MFDIGAVKQDFGRAAATYDRHASLQRQVRGKCLSWAQRIWSEGAAILDAGSGTGALFTECSEQGISWDITGVDVAFGMCSLAGKISDNIINADAASMPFADHAFEGIFSSLMLQWAIYPPGVWKEIYRVMKSGGKSILATLVQGTLGELDQAFQAIDTAQHTSDFLAADEVIAQAKAAGFAVCVMEEENVVEYHTNVLSLMQELKAIGANNKHVGRRKGLMTARQMAALEKSYRDGFQQLRGLPVTWRVLYLVVEKA